MLHTLHSLPISLDSSALIERLIKPRGTALSCRVLQVKKGLKLRLKDEDKGMLDADDLIGKLKVPLDSLADHDVAVFEERIRPQGTLYFYATWTPLDSKSVHSGAMGGGMGGNAAAGGGSPKDGTQPTAVNSTPDEGAGVGLGVADGDQTTAPTACTPKASTTSTRGSSITKDPASSTRETPAIVEEDREEEEESRVVEEEPLPPPVEAPISPDASGASPV